MNEPRIPVKIWVMLGLVILFALLLSYFLVIERRRCNRKNAGPQRTFDGLAAGRQSDRMSHGPFSLSATSSGPLKN